MVIIEDKRVLAREYADVSKAFAASGELPTAKDLAELAVDRSLVRDIVSHKCEVFPSVRAFPVPGENRSVSYVTYNLRYVGAESLNLHYVGDEGASRTEELKPGCDLASLTFMKTTLFPNDLTDRLLEMHSSGVQQSELYASFKSFFQKAGRSIPTFADVLVGSVRRDYAHQTISSADSMFRDENLFFLMMQADEYTRGMGVPSMLFGAAFDSQHREGCKYALAYTRMARFAERTKRRAASAEESWDYFDKVRNNGWEDWSMKFHVNAGADMLFALPNIAGDTESRNAGALAVYKIDDLFASGKLKRPEIRMQAVGGG